LFDQLIAFGPEPAAVLQPVTLSMDRRQFRAMPRT